MPETGPVSTRGLTIGGISAALAMLAAYTGQIDYLRDAVAEWLRYPQLRAVLVGMAIGCAFSAWVPYVLGKAFSSHRARAYMRFGSSVLTFGAAWSLQPTRLGFYYALLAALAGAQLYMTATRWLYRLFPALEPPALRETDQG
jgi:hypothetical protein